MLANEPLMKTPVKASLRGELKRNEPLARYTSWRIGGPAASFYMPADRVDLSNFLATLPNDEPIYWIGLGSNVLIADEGLPGTVVFTRGCLREMQLSAPQKVMVEAGVPCAHVARFCSEHGLIGAEFLAGIPGTMGGALAMNAGAFGGETWDLVKQVAVINRNGDENWHDKSEFSIAYRSVTSKADSWFSACCLQLAEGNTQESQLRIKQLLKERGLKQPMGQPSCGSVFRNPPGDYAARLIEECGFKGKQIGGAQVSEKHANFIVNVGDALADDVLRLIRLIQQRVCDKFGINLQLEVKLIGNIYES